MQPARVLNGVLLPHRKDMRPALAYTLRRRRDGGPTHASVNRAEDLLTRVRHLGAR